MQTADNNIDCDGSEPSETRWYLSPQLPTLHGLLTLEVTLNHGTVVTVVPRIGQLHRCFEKHAEHINFQQIIPYVDRIDYTAAMNNEHAYVMGVERMLGITDKIPKRVEYIRVLVCELNRVASHLFSLGTFGVILGQAAAFSECFRAREAILSLFEQVSGARLLYNYIWIGGVFYELPAGFEEKTIVLAQYLRQEIARIEQLFYEKEILAKTANVGILEPSEALSGGASGIVLRACGIPRDIRKIDNYSVYQDLEFDVPVGTAANYGKVGDTWTRYFLRIQEIYESLRIIIQCADKLLGEHRRTIDFDPRIACPKKHRISAQEYYVRAENPRGELGFFFVCQEQQDVPYRLKARTPSFCNLSLLPLIAKGCLKNDLVLILASLDLVIGEIDR